MDDLVATLSGTMHVSQEGYDLEQFKAALARTLIIPVSPSASSAGSGASLPHSRPASMHLQFTMDGLYAGAQVQPPPSPSSQCSQLEYLPSPPAYSYESDLENDAGLSAAFAGDAFKPMWEQQQVQQVQQQAGSAPAASDPWRLFTASKQPSAFGAAVQPQHQQFQFYQPQHQHQQYSQQYYEDDSMDEDAAEAVLDEEEAVNGGYARSW